MNKLILLLFLPLAAFACNTQVNGTNPSSSPSVTNSASVSPSPSVNTSSTPVASSPVPTPLVNVKALRGCNGSIILCQNGGQCAVAPCPTGYTPPKINAPVQIDEAKYDEIKNKFSLFSVSKSRDSLGGLNPPYPMAEGLKAKADENDGLSFNGGRLGSVNTLIIQNQDKSYQNIDNHDLLKKTFAPIESDTEAISYLTAATNTEPVFEIALDDTLRYYQPTIYPTTATLNNDKYRVNMFYYQKFGCGPHPTYEVIYDLNKNGDFVEISRKIVFEDPEKDGLCVD